MIPENIYKKTKKIDFEKLDIRKSLKLKPYNSDNIYDKKFLGEYLCFQESCLTIQEKKH